MLGPGVVVNHQSHLHYWKGSLTSRHSPVAMWHSQLQKCWDCAYNSELWKYPIRNRRKKKGGKVGAMHSGLVEKLVGSRAPWQGSCLGVTKWQYTVCLSQLNRLCLPAPPLQCPASLDSQWPHLLLWHKALQFCALLCSRLCDQWSVVQNPPCQKGPGEFWRREQHPCTPAADKLISPN